MRVGVRAPLLRRRRACRWLGGCARARAAEAGAERQARARKLEGR